MTEQPLSPRPAPPEPSTIWGERAEDWADVMEGPSGWGVPVYEHVLERISVDASTKLLDVGCGAGRFCRIARDRGVRVAGLDKTAEFIEIARARTPDGEFEIGEMESLPWQDDSFDVVTGFNSFFLAGDMVDALREARRVGRQGATVATTVFGRPEKCDSTRLFAAMRQITEGEASSPRAAAPKGPALHEEEVLRGVAESAGLAPVEVAYFEFDEDYVNLEAMVRGLLAAPPGRMATRASSEDVVAQALKDAARPNIQANGEVRLREEVRYLIATA
jgi:SAM-dependent methyltransferase